jgi:hypothetical protein
VAFAGWESQSVVYGVDHATLAELQALLDDRAAEALFYDRPFASVTAMGPESYVGPAALTQLRGHALTWWAAMNAQPPSLAGTFDGVTFDDHDAPIALDIANQASLSQLEAHGVAASPANTLVANRPYADLAAVAATKGIGTATMQALLAYAQSGTWGSPATCQATFEDAVSPHLADVLFLSESDRPLTTVAWPGAGTSAPTASSVLALVGAPAGSTASLRDPNNFYNNLEPSSSTADPTAAATIQSAFTAQLTDVVYVAVFPGGPSAVQVQVYLVGRTSCGDLVGLTSISIET